jgi:hypothetical protein
MKTPEEIKKWMECCSIIPPKCNECPANIENSLCDISMLRCTLAYIEQLEREKKDLLEERELNDFLRDKAKELEAQAHKWISVAERLPEYLVPVLAFRIHRHTPDDWYSDFCVFMRTEEYGMAERTGHYKVTYWMPLPEPPKEE